MRPGVLTNPGTSKNTPFTTEASAKPVVEPIAVQTFTNGLWDQSAAYLVKSRNPKTLTAAFSDALEVQLHAYPKCAMWAKGSYKSPFSRETVEVTIAWDVVTTTMVTATITRTTMEMVATIDHNKTAMVIGVTRIIMVIATTTAMTEIRTTTVVNIKETTTTATIIAEQMRTWLKNHSRRNSNNPVKMRT